MPSHILPAKDPDDVIDYAFDWATNMLASGEAITSHEITVDAGLTVDSSSEVDGVVTAWLSGGNAGEVGTLTCEITTNQGRTIERSATIQVNNL